MKVISNFTQTYSGTLKWSPGSDCKNRDFLIDAFCKDENKIKCYNLLDMCTFNFHNMEQDHSHKLISNLKSVLPNLKGFGYNNMSFGDCIWRHLNMLKAEGVTDFLWIQDDEFFTYDNFKDFKCLFEYYKKTPDIKHINLMYHVDDYQFTNYTPSGNDIIKINTNIDLYKTTTHQIYTSPHYAMNFSSFICDIDYFLEEMFDPNFISYLDAYQLEGGVNIKSRENNVERCLTNVNFFESFNIVGMGGSLGKSDESLHRLNELFLES